MGAQLPIRSRRTTGQRVPRPLDLCRRLGFNLERVQTRSKLFCEGGLEESVVLDYRLGFRFSEVEERGRNNNDRTTKRE